MSIQRLYKLRMFFGLCLRDVTIDQSRSVPEQEVFIGSSDGVACTANPNSLQHS